MAAKIKVIYIAGTGKSGSTLLGKLLGQVEGYLDVGELINVTIQHERNERCGCGELVGACQFWSQVLMKIGGSKKLDQVHWKRLKTRYLPLLAIPGAGRFLRRYFSQLYEVHKAIIDIGQGRVIVDSSKSAFYGAVLNLCPDIDVYTVHLVRDVRACEGSMYRLKSEGADKFAARSTGWNSLRWMIVNRMTEWAARRVGSQYLRIRYEDLVSDPQRTLSEITRLVENEPTPLKWIDGNSAMLDKTHSIAGSGVRFKLGRLELRVDERWKENLPLRNRAVVEGLTRRFRQRYGYN
ncbi:MAG: sulfotransferase [Chromatiales bacterium]|nr:sulfotransferase [Chromatiales bacterium]